ncbi:hypothetical protein QNI19_30785 [Cytophagaceae bacterium DM2B3-1]|uniref:Uncharacterized protein n=1 Tax=Xanthocytophaga flava TaxID=3048013 RepID=A0ABT7CUH5_9BACT|nr:hypothetical protein [Xanthocytophaga flavus]MDJ1497365.1 hypothetical protein [Xanthocytophaga flavus]
MLLTKTLSHKAFHYRRPLNLYMEWGTWNQDSDSNTLTTTHTLYIKNLPDEVNTKLIETTNIDVLMEIRDLINTNELYYAGSQIKMW